MSVFAVSTIDKGEIFADPQGTVTITDRVLVRCSNLNDNWLQIRAGCPQFMKWRPHPTQFGFYVNQFRPIQRQHTGNWECQVDYINTILPDPLGEPAVIGEVKTMTIPGATLVDWQNNPILNTAGEPPEPFDFPEQVIVFPVSKNVGGLPGWAFDFECCINEDQVKIGNIACGPLTCMIRNVTISAEDTSGPIAFRTVTCEVWKRKSKWQEIWPSRGFNQLVRIPQGGLVPGGIAQKTTYQLRPIVDDSGENIKEPQFLDKNGAWIQNPTPQQIFMITTQLYPSIGFTGLFPLQ